MTPEQDRCIQIGRQDDPQGQPISQEYLLNRGGEDFIIEVVGVPPHPSLRDTSKEEIPPLAVSALMLRNSAQVCDFILTAPFSSLKNHLVRQKTCPSNRKDNF